MPNGAQTTWHDLACDDGRIEPTVCLCYFRVALRRLRVDGTALSSSSGSDLERLPGRCASYERPVGWSGRVAQRFRRR